MSVPLPPAGQTVLTVDETVALLKDLKERGEQTLATLDALQQLPPMLSDPATAMWINGLITVITSHLDWSSRTTALLCNRLAADTIGAHQ
jgi:hypothetical protein